ncbi:hypothetical protein CKA32_006958 [Geitlerinema sp. FC II]|nr:hypothetical protein CKA32_006958 [Geitlerinema sp. FC II]
MKSILYIPAIVYIVNTVEIWVWENSKFQTIKLQNSLCIAY